MRILFTINHSILHDLNVHSCSELNNLLSIDLDGYCNVQSLCIISEKMSEKVNIREIGIISTRKRINSLIYREGNKNKKLKSSNILKTVSHKTSRESFVCQCQLFISIRLLYYKHQYRHN